jgi:hypothetical protein
MCSSIPYVTVNNYHMHLLRLTHPDLKYLTVLRRWASSGMLRRVALVRADVSDELSVSFIRVTRIGELGIMLAG